MSEKKEKIENDFSKLETFQKRVNFINRLPSTGHDPNNTVEPQSPRLKAASLALSQGFDLQPKDVPEGVTLTLWGYSLYSLHYSGEEVVKYQSKMITSKSQQDYGGPTWMEGQKGTAECFTVDPKDVYYSAVKKITSTPFKDYMAGLKNGSPALIVQATSQKGPIYLYSTDTTSKAAKPKK